MSRQKKWEVANAIYEIYTTIPKTRTQINEWERDLIATANCAIWDENLRKLVSCLRRLQGSPERKQAYTKVMGLLQ